MQHPRMSFTEEESFVSGDRAVVRWRYGWGGHGPRPRPWCRRDPFPRRAGLREVLLRQGLTRSTAHSGAVVVTRAIPRAHASARLPLLRGQHVDDRIVGDAVVLHHRFVVERHAESAHHRQAAEIRSVGDRDDPGHTHVLEAVVQPRPVPPRWRTRVPSARTPGARRSRGRRGTPAGGAGRTCRGTQRPRDARRASRPTPSVAKHCCAQAAISSECCRVRATPPSVFITSGSALSAANRGRSDRR